MTAPVSYFSSHRSLYHADKWPATTHTPCRAIAVAVTGTRWNGLAFFGLTGKAAANRKEPARAKQ